jgi:hypothetical protein
MFFWEDFFDVTYNAMICFVCASSFFVSMDNVLQLFLCICKEIAPLENVKDCDMNATFWSK